MPFVYKNVSQFFALYKQTVSRIRRFFCGGEPENTVLWCITCRVVSPIVANVYPKIRESLPDRLSYVFNNRLIIRVINKQKLCNISCACVSLYPDRYKHICVCISLCPDRYVTCILTPRPIVYILAMYPVYISNQDPSV